MSNISELSKIIWQLQSCEPHEVRQQAFRGIAFLIKELQDLRVRINLLEDKYNDLSTRR